MTQASQVSPSAAGVVQRGMTFSVDGWDPSYGASLELEGQLAESTARIDASVEVPAERWRPIDPDNAGPLPEALLFVDGVRRVEGAESLVEEDRVEPRGARGGQRGDVRRQGQGERE